MEEKAVTTTNQNILIPGQSQNERSYCSYEPKTMEEKQEFFNMMNRCTGRLNDMQNQIVRVKHIYMQQFNRKDKETGEERIGRRTILITEDKKSYVTMSSYFQLQLSKLIAAFGTPDQWEKPLAMKIVKQKRDGIQGEILQFELVKD